MKVKVNEKPKIFYTKFWFLCTKSFDKNLNE